MVSKPIWRRNLPGKDKNWIQLAAAFIAWKKMSLRILCHRPERERLKKKDPARDKLQKLNPERESFYETDPERESF